MPYQETIAGTFIVLGNIAGQYISGQNLQLNHSTLTYGATTTIDFAGNGYRTVTLAGNVTFTGSNMSAGRNVAIRVVGDNVNRTVTFPTGWSFVSNTPTGILANSKNILSVTAFGINQNDIMAAFASASGCDGFLG